ncbi:MAG: tetratricopeptide repeat protein, partial [Flavobacteriaceae bacterium]|nr:tetratricopeptide repeat protein [Flavobacteriaceae bacterium]
MKKKHTVESYFEEKVKNNQFDTNLNRFCLYKTYSRNGKIEQSIAVLKELLEENPNSSFIKGYLAESYEKINDETSQNKILDNIQLQDPDYYLSLLLDFQNISDLMKEDIETYNNKLNKIASAIDYEYMKSACELLILLRQENKKEIRKALDKLMSHDTLPSNIRVLFSDFYSKLFNDDKATINLLEGYNKKEFDTEVIDYLAYYYQKQNKIQKTIDLYDEALVHFKHSNNFLYKIISVLHENNQYEKSLKYIDQGLKNFPNSYIFTKLKGDVYVQLKNDKKAIELYENALTKRPANSSIRNKLYDLKNTKNPILEFHFEDAYDYVKQNRGKIKENNYGLNTLFNQTDVFLYKSGGGEYQVTQIYEITSQNGIDIFKEYSLGLGGNYKLNKTEIVKPGGEVVPADRNGSDLVFDELEIGDVIYIDYNTFYSKSGRFYKDYIMGKNFQSYHPSMKTSYRVLTYDKNVNFKITNGDINFKKYKKGDLYIHEWIESNIDALPIAEDYMPSFIDVSTRLHISS